MRRKKKVSKKTIIVLTLLALLACYKWLPRHHEIRNVYDEIYVRFPERDFTTEYGLQYYVYYYGAALETITIEYKKGNQLDILCRDDTSIINTTLYYRAIYDVNEKQLRRLIYVIDETKEPSEECSREKTDILLSQNGTSYEKEKERLMRYVDEFIEQWITSNAGKTKFSLDNLGEYTALPVVLGEDIGTGR